MKTTLLFSLLICASTIVTAQTTQKTTSGIVTMNGADLNKMIDQSGIVYDEEGNKVDSLKVADMLKGEKYRIVLMKKNSDSLMRRVIQKRDLVKEAEQYELTKIALRPPSPKLQVGTTLNLDPLAKKTNIEALTQKSILMIFWHPGCFSTNNYDKVNELIRSIKNPKGLEVLLISYETVNSVADGLKQTPIFYNQLFVDAGAVTKAYQTENMPIMLVADQNHTIKFASWGNSDSVIKGLKEALLEVDK
ncbi:hypothetical protein [Pedobacter foliorum]|uniref:hypothetical protein n=1 Tax=Pedobacter foliorum TaxID=2739058 RepID=UPI0015649EB6|nr:hypothetical protein [Pedobacter foliorum]NRF37294.1 hypothetical protein [Pedobacter foliorum]